MKYADVIKSETKKMSIEVEVDSKTLSFLQDYNIDTSLLIKLAVEEIKESMEEKPKKVVVVQEKVIKPPSKPKQEKIALPKHTMASNTAIVDLLRKGYSYTDIAKILRKTKSNIYNRVWRYDLKAKAKQTDYNLQDDYCEEERLYDKLKAIIEENEQGMTSEEIRKLLPSYAPNSIYTELSKLAKNKEIVTSNTYPKKYYPYL